MKRLLLLALTALLLAPAHAAGDGCPPETCGVQSTAIPGSPVVAVRPMGAYDVYDVSTGKLRFSLPNATQSADGRVVWSADNVRRSTLLRRYDAHTGRLVRTWSLGPKLWAPAVSADGRRVVLLDASARTRIVVFDSKTGRAQTVALHGNFEPEAISRDGRRLFLIEYLKGGYRVRLYDLASGALRPGQLKPQNEREPMTGYPVYAIGAPDGHWLLTLYAKPHEAFVHALDLRRGVAYCLDLPGRGRVELQEWALALGLDGKTLYAANGALGLATRIDLSTLESARPLRFAVPLKRDQVVNSALSPRGDLLYFGGLHGIWAWDLRVNRLRGPYRPNRIGGLGFTPDGRRLTVITPGGHALWLDAATGRRV
jgi:hypothetical protein